jgi:SAM-dependent methyltransferase
MDGWVNCDYHSTPAADCVFDLTKPWPFASDTVEHIYASHVLEHLPDPWTFFAEAWRVLRPAGSALMIRVPYGGNTSAWADLTHLRPWYPQSFACFQPGYGASIGNPQSEKIHSVFGFLPIQVRVAGIVSKIVRIPGLRRMALRLLPFIPELSEEIYVQAFPLKTPLAVELYRQTHSPRGIGLQYIVYEHEKKREPMRADGTVRLVEL